jgi:hypothetical protein
MRLSFSLRLRLRKCDLLKHVRLVQCLFKNCDQILVGAMVADAK